MRHRSLFAFLLLLLLSTAGLAGVTVTPTSLDFGSVNTGQAKTLVLTVKNDTKLSSSGAVTATFPFTVAPAALSIPNLSTVSLSVTLPATAPLRTHNGTVTITIPALIAGNPPTEIKIAVTASVVAGTGIDLKVGTITIKSCSVNSQGTFRSCSFFVPFLTTGTAIIPVKTTLFEARGSGPLTQTFNQQFAYNPPDVLPFIYVISQLPLDIATVTIKIIVDPDGQVAEANEGNNTVTKVLNVQ